MEISSIAFSLIASTAVMFGTAASSFYDRISTVVNPALGVQQESTNYAAAKPACKKGISKAGKSPISLVPGAKVSCYNILKATAGRKLLTTDKKNTCYACHSKLGTAPASRMNSNLRDQGYNLTPAKLVEAFNAHLEEMPGSTMSVKQAKLISQYLQSLKTLP